MTENEIRDYIKAAAPYLTSDQVEEVRDDFIYVTYDLNTSIEKYLRKLQIEEWNNIDDKYKNYYRVKMLNGGTKIVFMCEDQVKFIYGNRIIGRL